MKIQPINYNYFNNLSCPKKFCDNERKQNFTMVTSVSEQFRECERELNNKQSAVKHSSDKKQIIEPIGEINEPVSAAKQSMRKENLRLQSQDCDTRLNLNSLDSNSLKCTNKTDSYFKLPDYKFYTFLFASSKKRTYSSNNNLLKEIPGNFKICNLDGIICPACGKKMLSEKKYIEICEKLQNIPKDQYLNFLYQYRDYMRPVETSVFDEIFSISKLKGNSKDIRTLLVNLRNTKLPLLQEAQMKQINKMFALAKTLPSEEKRSLNSKIIKLKKEIHRKNALAPFRRKVMIDRISKLKIKNPRNYKKLQMIAHNFPTSTDMTSAWIVKYSGQNKKNQNWDSYTIATRFLASSVSNTDHIMPYSSNPNHDDISNYMAMHNACNTQKSDKSFLHWINEDKKNRIKFIKQYFFDVSENISNHKITDNRYKNYVAYATNTIYIASHGQINLFKKYQHKI